MFNHFVVDGQVLIEFQNSFHNSHYSCLAKIISIWQTPDGARISYTARILPAAVRLIEKNLCGVENCQCNKISMAARVPELNVHASIIQRSDGRGEPMLLLWDVPSCEVFCLEATI